MDLIPYRGLADPRCCQSDFAAISSISSRTGNRELHSTLSAVYLGLAIGPPVGCAGQEGTTQYILYTFYWAFLLAVLVWQNSNDGCRREYLRMARKEGFARGRRKELLCVTFMCKLCTPPRAVSEAIIIDG